MKDLTHGDSGWNPVCPHSIIRAMICTRSMSDGWLSNTWLVADAPGGQAVVVDTGGPLEPICRQIEELRVTVTHVLCTHHHIDHVVHNDEYRAAYGCPVCGHASERDLFGSLDQTLEDGEEIVSGDLHVRALHIPGHTLGQLGFVVNDTHVFTGDTLFQGSVGGTRGVGHTNFDDLRTSVMDVLMGLPKDTVVCPGHMEQTSIRREWEDNPFVRLWRGVDAPQCERCLAFGRPAELLLRAVDYDGGHKCQVRFDDGTIDVVPGSRVTDA